MPKNVDFGRGRHPRTIFRPAGSAGPGLAGAQVARTFRRNLGNGSGPITIA